MSETAENTRLLQEAWQKWHDTRGTDTSIWDDYVHKDFTLYSLANGEEPLGFTAVSTCPEDFKRYLEGLTSTFEMNHWQIDETVAEGDRVSAIGSTSWTHRTTGKTFTTPVAIATKWRDGRMYEYREFYDTAMVMASAG